MTGRLTGAIELPDGTWVRGRGLRLPLPQGPTPDYGLYLGVGSFRKRFDPDLTWPHDWVAWPDMMVPLSRRRAVADIRRLHERALAGQRVEVACGAGRGRTGTVISCLAILAGVPHADAVTWTRTHHDPRSVETAWQRLWVSRFPGAAA